MYRHVLFLCPFLLCAALASAEDPAVLTSAREYCAFLSEANSRAPGEWRPYAFTGCVSRILSPTQFVLDDGTGRLDLRIRSGHGVRSGDVLAIGRGKVNCGYSPWNPLDIGGVKRLGQTNAPAAASVGIADLNRAELHLLPVRTSGLVEDVFTDDVDPDWSCLTLCDGTERLCVYLTRGSQLDRRCRQLLDAQIEISGVYMHRIPGARRFLGGQVLADVDSSVRVLEPPPPDRLSYPPLPSMADISSTGLPLLGRRSVEGQVKACWQGNRLLLDTARGFPITVTLSEGEDRPVPGAWVKAAGLVQTDLYTIDLQRAHVRPIDGPSQPVRKTATAELGPDDLLSGTNDVATFNWACFGQPIHIEGVVRELQGRPPSGSLELDCGRMSLTVDATACPSAFTEIRKDCRLAVRGVCLFDTDRWTPGQPLPRIRGVIVALNDPADVQILAAPPWWTPSRLLAAVALLCLLVLVIGIWNILLRRLAERRGHALADEVLARTESEFKVLERTRLAVELHDSLSQNLSSISMEIDSAKNFSKTDAVRMHEHLTLATRSLQACKSELKNCLWDLRSNALGLSTFDEAIRQAVAPHVGSAHVAVRFNVPRDAVSDTTAHDFLRIIRELVTNAVRHGQATDIRIAGCLDGGRLLFSVVDNGCGFDPRSCPGIRDGHFGLQGIYERVENLNGQTDITSKTGQGTHVTIELPLPNLVKGNKTT